MKILLINPPQNTRYPQPPLGLASIAAVLEGEGHQVEILDANALPLAEPDIARSSGGFDVIGITAMTPFISSAIRLAREIKRERPDAKIVMGGAHVTVLAEETLSHVPQIDVVVRGEGEETVVELFRALGEGSSLQDIRGITYRDNGTVRSTPLRPPIAELDSLPFPAYHLLPLDRYRLHPPHGRKMPLMAMLTSRGCPYNCLFCSKPVFGRRFRAQSPKRTADEIEHLARKFNIREIAFYDDIFTLEPKRVVKLAKELRQRRLGLPWTCETRVDSVAAELLKTMKGAGCYMIAYGIESGNQAIIDNLRKKTTIEQVRKAVGLTRRAGIQSVGYFMLGSPGETPDTVRQTIDFARELGLDFAQFSITIPFPGTDLYELYLKQGLSSQNWDDFIYASLRSASAPVFETALLSRDDLRRWSARAYKAFYLRLPYIWRRLRQIRSWGDVKTNLRGLRMFWDMVRGG